MKVFHIRRKPRRRSGATHGLPFEGVLICWQNTEIGNAPTNGESL